MEIEKLELKKFQDWQKLCNAAIDPFILIDLEGNVITLNKEAAKLLDKSVDELIGWNSYNFMALNEVKFFKAQINNITRLRKPVRVEKEIFGRTFDLSISLIFDEQGKAEQIAFFLHDITERKRAEELLKESKEVFQDAYNRMLLYQNLITHDIRNVLNSVQSLTYLYNRDRNNRSKMNNVLKMIKEQIVKGDKLIRNVLKLSNLEIMEISLKPVDVLNVIEKSIKFLHDSFLNRDISIQVDSVSNEFIAQADDFLIDAFENLLNNAVKHNNNPIAEILIRIAKEERGMKKYIKLEFIDNGNGIPDNRKQSIFQKNHTKKEYAKGLGIGLSLVFKIIKNCSGEIWVEDKVNGDRSKGSKFVILIPEAY